MKQIVLFKSEHPSSLYPRVQWLLGEEGKATKREHTQGLSTQTQNICGPFRFLIL